MLRSRPDFRRAYLANAVSQLGDSFQFVAVMWLAVVTGGVFGVIAVRLADGLPALLLALVGGAAADRRDRRRTMIACDLVRAAVLVPIAIGGLTGQLSIWAVAPAGFIVAAAASFFTPAYAASLPALAGRENIQRANGLMTATNGSVMVAGRALASAILAVVSVASFFAINALSFCVSALLLTRVRIPRQPAAPAVGRLSVRAGFEALRVRPGLRVAIAMLAVGTALMTGVWTVGVAELARTRLGHGAASLSILFTATAVGTVAISALLTWRPVRLKVRLSCASWLVAAPGFALLGTAGSLGQAVAGTFLVGVGSGAALVLLTTAAQESVPEEALGRVMGVVLVASAGSKPLGLLLLAPLYTVFGLGTVFVAGGLAAAMCAAAATCSVASATRAARLAEAV